MKALMKGRSITDKVKKDKSPRKEKKAFRQTGKKIFLPAFLFLSILLNSNAFSDSQEQSSVTPVILDDTTFTQTPTTTATMTLSNTPTATPTCTPQFIITITDDKAGSVAVGDTVHYTIYYSLIGSYYTPNAYLNIYTIDMFQVIPAI